MAALPLFSAGQALPLSLQNRLIFAHFFWPYCFVKKPSSSSRSGDISLKEGLEALVRTYRLQGKLNEVTVVSSWERVMGKAVALKTQEVYVNQGKLFVRLTSAPLKHELLMAKTRVAELINAEVGETVIKEVIFL
jgi:predicted nucleic acid-binding Zn ribbon protein